MGTISTDGLTVRQAVKHAKRLVGQLSIEDAVDHVLNKPSIPHTIRLSVRGVMIERIKQSKK